LISKELNMNYANRFLLLAAIVLTTATTAFCDKAEDIVNRGLAKQRKGDLDGAIADYTKAIELKPDLAVAYVNRGNAKQAKSDLDGAIADFTGSVAQFVGCFREFSLCSIPSS
jgi:tetratricopeptide (TPR) repeat protein